MKSSAVDVGDYVAEVDETGVPSWCSCGLRVEGYLTGYEETMAYGMPLQLNGQPEVAFARQVKHFSLYIMKEEVLDATDTICDG